MFDDLCDGGKTFTVLAKELHKHNPAKLDLAVSHGFFTKGEGILFDCGYTNVYTTNSLLQNLIDPNPESGEMIVIDINGGK